ncbi:Septin-10 [Manis javanica]|nr:Septin-10 [Manis javanica]
MAPALIDLLSSRLSPGPCAYLGVPAPCLDAQPGLVAWPLCRQAGGVAERRKYSFFNCVWSWPLSLGVPLLTASWETGIGKSTLIDTLFNTNFENQKSSRFYLHVRLKAQTYELQESNVQLKLTIVNTVGFSDQISKEDKPLSEDTASLNHEET